MKFSEGDVLRNFEDRPFTGTLENNCFVEKFQKCPEKHA